MSSSSSAETHSRTNRKFPVEDILAAIKAHHGNISRIALQFNVQRSNIYQKIHSKRTLIQALHDEREAWKDLAESNLYEDLVAKERYATLFVLQTLARDRGWVLSKNAGSPFGDGDHS